MGPFASEVPDFAGFLKAVRHEFEKAVSAASHSMDVGRLQATERLAKCLIVLCRFAETSWFTMFVYSRCLQRFSAYVRMLLSSDKKNDFLAICILLCCTCCRNLENITTISEYNHMPPLIALAVQVLHKVLWSYHWVAFSFLWILRCLECVGFLRALSLAPACSAVCAICCWTDFVACSISCTIFNGPVLTLTKQLKCFPA